MCLIIQNVYCWLIKNMSFNLLLLIHILLKNIQEFHYYSFAVNLDRYVKNGNTLNELCNKICFPNKKEDLNLSMFNIGEKWSKQLTNHMSWKCKYKFDGRKCNFNQWWNSIKG